MPAAKAVIHLGNLRQNIRLIRNHVGNERKICCAVKADAYGHGATEVSRVLIEENVSHLAVATVREGIDLREAGIETPILLFAPPLPEERPAVLSSRLTPLIFDFDTCRDFVPGDAGGHRTSTDVIAEIRRRITDASLPRRQVDVQEFPRPSVRQSMPPQSRQRACKSKHPRGTVRRRADRQHDRRRGRI